jgi:hypothetical protein
MNYLISADEVIRRGLTHANVDAKTIVVAIARAQDIHIQTALGTCLYNELLTRVLNDNWDANYSLLMNQYVLPCLVAFVDYRMIDYSTEKITNKATGYLQDANLQPMNAEQRNPMRDRLRKDAYFYKERLIGFLKDDDANNYPLYKDCECKKENVKKEKTGYLTKWIV